MNTFSKLLEFGAVSCTKDNKTGLFSGKVDFIKISIITKVPVCQVIEVTNCQTGDDAMRKLFDKAQIKMRKDRDILRTDLKKAKSVKAEKGIILQLTSKLKLFEKKYNYLLDS